MKKEIQNICPIYSIENDIICNQDGDISIAYKLEIPEAFSQDKITYEEVILGFSSALNSLPVNFCVQLMSFHYPETINCTPQSDSIIERKNVEYLSGRTKIKSESYVIVSKISKKVKRTYGGVIFSSKGLFEEKVYESGYLNDFTGNASRFIQLTKSLLKTDYKKLNSHEAVELILGKYLNMDLANGNSNYSSGIYNAEDFCVFGDKIINVFTMDSDGYPSKLSTSKTNQDFFVRNQADLQNSNVYNLAYGLKSPHIIQNCWFTTDQREVREDLDGRVTRLNTLLQADIKDNKGNENQVLKDLIQKTLEDMRENSSIKLIHHHFGVILIGSVTDKKSHEENKNELMNVLTQLNIKFNSNQFNVANYIFSCCPGNATQIPDDDRGLIETEESCLFFCLESNYKECSQGVRLLERQFGTPLLVDTWRNPNITNRGQIIVGPAGTGKSHFCNHMIESLSQNTDMHVVILDIGGSYKKLCEMKQGLYIDCSFNNPLTYNPFVVANRNKEGIWLPDSNSNKEFHNIELNYNSIMRIKLLIFASWKGSEKISVEENALMDELIIEYYDYLNKNKKVEALFDTFYTFITKEKRDSLLNVPRDLFDFTSFEITMKAFTTGGKYGHLFNTKRNIDLYNEKFVVFELEEIREEKVLFPLTSLIAKNIVLNKLLNNKSEYRVFVVMDEVWSILNSNLSIFIEYLYRTCRKKNGSVCIISQSINDIIQSQVRNAITTNADTMIFLKQKLEDKNIFSEDLDMKKTPHHLDLLYSLKSTNKYREIFIKFRDEAKVYRHEVSRFTNLVYSTTPQDNAVITPFLETTNGNLAHAIEKLIEYENSN